MTSTNQLFCIHCGRKATLSLGKKDLEVKNLANSNTVKIAKDGKVELAFCTKACLFEFLDDHLKEYNH